MTEEPFSRRIFNRPDPPQSSLCCLVQDQCKQDDGQQGGEFKMVVRWTKYDTWTSTLLHYISFEIWVVKYIDDQYKYPMDNTEII